VLDAAGSRRAVLFGASEGGPACIKFAADHPDRVAGLILFASLAKGSAAPDYPHALQAGQFDVWLKELITIWGGPAGIETFAPSLSGDPQARAWWAGLLRAASSPGALKGVLEALRDADVRNILGRISAPTLVLHRRGDRAVRIGAGRHLASHIVQARFVELDGADHWVFAGDPSSPTSNNSSAVSRPDRAGNAHERSSRCTYKSTPSISSTPSPPVYSLSTSALRRLSVARWLM
jgi:pimeloyl-ACP methyl ester carboxylesterase